MKKRTLKYWLLILGLSFISASIACGNNGEDEHEHDDKVSPEEELCEHMGEAVTETLTASEMMTDAPVLDAEHTRTDVDELSDTEKFISFEAGESGDYLFAVSADVEISVQGSDGNAVEVESTESQDSCDAINKIITVELEVGTYYIGLSGSTDIIGIGFEHADGEHNHDEG